MSRWREKRPPSSPYITPEGYARLEHETRQLWQKRDEVRQALSAAAAEGDRSENAEYIYRKKQLRELDGRITYLQKRMPSLQIVHPPDRKDQIRFGARVKLENDSGELSEFRIVGADEFDHTENGISIDAPVARALIGKSVDDEVSIETQTGIQAYIVIEINYRLSI